MPPIFKALASISAWVLFIMGWIGLLMPQVMAFATGSAFVRPPGWEMWIPSGMGMVSLILAVCAMKLRQMLE